MSFPSAKRDWDKEKEEFFAKVLEIEEKKEKFGGHH
jgi:hypothetical protein